MFLLDEPIRLHARLPDRKDGDAITWRLTGDGGQKRLTKSAVTSGRTGLLVEPLALGTIVLSSTADNPLMHKLVKGYGLCPWKLREDAPGAGRSVVWWAAAAFGLDHQIVAVYAAAAPGLTRGVDAVSDVR